MKAVLTEQVAQIISGLWESHHDRIIAELGSTDANKLSVSVGIKIRTTSTGYSLKAKIGYGAKHTDESEADVEDPNQEKLPL